MLRGFVLAFAAVGALLALSLVGGGILLSTPEGTRRVGEVLIGAALHRTVRFDRLQAHLLTATPSVHAEGVVVSSPADVTRADLLHARTLDASFDWSGLPLGKLRFHTLDLGRPELHLVRLRAGRNNYTFGAGGAGSALRTVTRLTAVDGTMTYDDPERQLRLVGDFSHAAHGGGQTLHLQGGGVAHGQPFVATASGGPLNGRAPDDPYAFAAHLVDGDTDLVLSGVTQKPFDFRGFDFKVRARGPNLADFHYVFGVDPVNSPPFALSSHAVKANHLTRFSDLSGTVGASDLAGEIAADDRGPRRKIIARLRARTLHVADVAALLSPAPDHATARRQAGRAEAGQAGAGVSDRPFSLHALRAKDLDIALDAQTLAGAPLALSELSARILLSDGRLSVAPLTLQVGGGRLRASAVLDARGAVPTASLTAGLSQAGLARLQPALARTLDGRLAAHVAVSSSGASPAAMAARLSGRAAVILADGRLARGPANALGGDLVKGLLSAAAGPRAAVRLQCAGGSATLSGGRVSLDDVRLYTDVGETEAHGAVDLGRNQLSVRLVPKPRPGDLAQTPAPITVTGPLARPKIAADVAGAATGQGVGGVIKLALSPLTSLLPTRPQDYAAACARMAASVR